MNISIGIIGLGFVGGAMYKSFKEKGINVYGYDKFKDSDSLEECLSCSILFLCLPTQFNESTSSYDKSCIEETLYSINNNLVVQYYQ